MLKAIVCFAETTAPASEDISRHTMHAQDPYSTVFRSMRVRGSLLLHEHYSPPWGIDIPGSADLAKAMGEGQGSRVVPFHIVRQGHFDLQPVAAPAQRVEAGQLAICFGGQPHRMARDRAPRAIGFEELLASEGANIFRPLDPCDPGATHLVCGAFVLRDTRLNPLFAALPGVLVAPFVGGDGRGDLGSLVGLLVHELEQRRDGGEFMVERLVELLCAEAIRTQQQLPDPAVGWFRGLRDPLVGRSIASIHAAPEHDWSVRSLAEEAQISPSRFAARFRETLGESPMLYLTKWRMNVASRLLDRTELGIGAVASRVGYGNLASFSRAFKKHLGSPPATWRADRALARNSAEQLSSMPFV